MSHNFSDQDLQFICEHTLSLFWMLGPIIKIPYQGADHLTQLNSKTEMVYQSLKGLFAFMGSNPNNILPQAIHALKCKPLPPGWLLAWKGDALTHTSTYLYAMTGALGWHQRNSLLKVLPLLVPFIL